MAEGSVNPNKALWEKGDFTRIAATMRESGDGTTALPSAKLGADVLGVDIARNLVEAGNRRATEQGLSNLAFGEGDATNLEGIPDRSFDVVMGNWIPNDPTLVAQILKISSAYTPPPPEGFVSPMTWGVESHVIERFTRAGAPSDSISMVQDTFIFRRPGSPAAFVEDFRRYYGPTMKAFDAAEKNGRAADLQRELEELFMRQNTESSATSIPATFLRVEVAC